MSKYIDWSFNGGLPMTQEVMAFIQESVRERFEGIAKMGMPLAGYTAPLIISGCLGIIAGYTDGWVYYNGEMYYFAGGSNALGSNMILNELRTTAVFEDGSSHDIFITKTMKLGTATLQWPMTSLKRFHYVFGALTEGTEFNMVISNSSAGNASGNVYYRRNNLANALHIYGTIALLNPSVLADPAQYYTCGTIATSDHIPNVTAPFICNVRYHGSAYVKEVGNIDYIKNINAELTNTGDLNFGFIKPAVAVSSYTISFNILIPLA